MTFAEICRRASGRRAYNRRRRLARERRILDLLFMLDVDPTITGRLCAAVLKVHESTVSRDLKFLNRVRADYRRLNGCELRPGSFRWRRNGYETVFEVRAGVRVR